MLENFLGTIQKDTTETKYSFLNSNMLKIFAAITMFIDHFGFVFFPNIDAFRIVGRFAFPIFAFLIADGCRYTHNKLKYVLSLLGVGMVCEFFYYIVSKSFQLNILFTFTLSIIAIYILQEILTPKNELPKRFIFGIALIGYIVAVFFFTRYVSIDYGFFGVFVPVAAAVTNRKIPRILLFGIGLVVLAYFSNHLQWFGLLALVPLFFYNGKRGTAKLKYFFYIFYPAQFVVLYLISLIVK